MRDEIINYFSPVALRTCLHTSNGYYFLLGSNGKQKRQCFL